MPENVQLFAAETARACRSGLPPPALPAVLRQKACRAGGNALCSRPVLQQSEAIMADSASGAAMEAALPCLNFPVNVRSLPPKGLTLTLETDENERAALAKAHGLLAVHKFSAAFQLKPWKKQGVRLEGRIEAEIEQQCVITAEPLRNIIKEEFEAYYVPEGSRLARPEEGASAELFLDPAGADAPESFNGGSINAGAVAEEFFELAIDPYPRKAGARLADVWQAEAAEAGAAGETAAADVDAPQSPFAALQNLRRQ